ncbi:hypothetical protein R1flu_008803 [Riccia fluitans]|uniref:Uncharacterized protein n=1 Tax=Riccia fluitans TaxID=41844 RepID=A0ABD1XHH8_9MARC
MRRNGWSRMRGRGAMIRRRKLMAQCRICTARPQNVAPCHNFAAWHGAPKTWRLEDVERRRKHHGAMIRHHILVARFHVSTVMPHNTALCRKIVQIKVF